MGLPAPTPSGPSDRDWTADVSAYVITVTVYDESGMELDDYQLYLLTDSTIEDGYLAASVTEPATL